MRNVFVPAVATARHVWMKCSRRPALCEWELIAQRCSSLLRRAPLHRRETHLRESDGGEHREAALPSCSEAQQCPRSHQQPAGGTGQPPSRTRCCSSRSTFAAGRDRGNGGLGQQRGPAASSHPPNRSLPATTRAWSPARCAREEWERGQAGQ